MLFSIKKPAFLFWLTIIIAIVLTACDSTEPAVIVQTIPVEATRIVERVKEVTVVETVVVEVAALPPTPEPETARDTLVICAPQEPDSLYFVASNMYIQRELYNAYMDRASTADTAYWFHTDLLEKFPTLEDGDAVLVGEPGSEGHLEMTYKIKPGITWHDGEPLSAADFVYAYQVWMDPSSDPYRRKIWERVEKMEAVDDLTLKVTLKKGVMDPTYGPSYIPEPLPKHALESMPPATIADSEYARSGYPGVGPFVFEERVMGDHISFTRNESYYREGPHFERVVFRFFLDPNALMASLIAGKCDVLTSDGLQTYDLPFLQGAKTEDLANYHVVAGPVWEHLDMNQWPWDDRYPWFAKKEVRQAVAYGTNREWMIDELLHGTVEPMQSWIPADSWAFNPDVKPYPWAPARAEELLASVGFEDRDGDGIIEAYDYSGAFPDGTEWSIPNGTPFEIALSTTGGGEFRERIAQIFQASMEQIGIKVDLDLQPPSDFFAGDGPLVQRRFDVCTYAWVANPDPGGDALWIGVDVLDENGNVLFPEQIPSDEDGWTGQNYGGWVHKKASRLIFDASHTLEQDERIRLYHEQQEIFMEEVPTLPLFQRILIAGFAPDLQGWEMGPANYLTWNIHEWYIEE